MNFRAFEAGKHYQEFRGMNGAKLYEQDGRLFLVISYDDILDEEVDAFQNAPFEVVFKTFGLISLFTFRFREYIVDAPFNQFMNFGVVGRNGYIPMVIFVFESSSGAFIAKRESILPEEFGCKLLRLLNERYAEYAGKYNLGAFNRGMKEIYDNHAIDELYGLPGDREIRCIV